jgi:carbon starvation protein
MGEATAWAVMAAIVAIVVIALPVLRMPALSEFAWGGGPIVPGFLFPFVFVTIACGAISGFHALVASGTTPKMIDRESDARAIGYGAMLMESLVGVTALVAASSRCPADYYQINMRPQAFAELIRLTGLEQCHLSELSALVGEPRLAGRTGGGVSLAVGIADIFGGIRGIRPLMRFVYHFVIMFEALFVLTAIDTGTRIGRFLVHEALGRVSPKLGRTDWMPGTVLTSPLVVGGWSYFIFTGTIQTLWPMFGVANQLLAVVALAVGATVLVNEGRGRYAWVALCPLAVVATTTLAGGFLSIRNIFLPMALHPRVPGEAFKGWLNSGLTAVLMPLVVGVLAGAVPRWRRHSGRERKETVEKVQRESPSNRP